MRRIFLVLFMSVLIWAGALTSASPASADDYTLNGTSFPGIATITMTGETVSVTGTGLICWVVGCNPETDGVDPNGNGNPANSAFLSPTCGAFTLIARFDDGAWDICVGAGPTEITGSGLLHFGFNDTVDTCVDGDLTCPTYDGNQGSWTVSIKPVEEPTPEPTAAPPVTDVEVNIHVRDCPAGAEQAFADCHPFGIPDAEVVLTDANDPAVSAGALTDADGNATLYGYAGSWGLYVNPGEDYILVSAYCSYEENIGDENFIDLSLPVIVESGDVIYCDIYFTGGADNSGGDDGSGDDGSGDNGSGDDNSGIGLPNTGSGHGLGSASAGDAGLLISVVIATAFMVRRRQQGRA